MNFSPTFSPAPLSYCAALRGAKPRNAGTSFSYAVVNCTTPNLLMALAASNPEGQFYGLMPNVEGCRDAAQEALMRQVSNVNFLHATPTDALGWFEKKSYQMSTVDYLCCDESEKPLSASERAAVFDLAAKALKDGGLLSISYKSYADEDGALRFLVREFAPEMSPAQACEFLLELKKLGTFYFKQHAALAAKLDQAIIHNMPDEFFSLFEDGASQSKTFDTIVAMASRGFTYAGDSSAAANYVELSVPVEAQPIIVACRDNHLYEPLKDFAQNRSARSDIWCKQPAVRSSDLAQLFGAFSYGITLPRAKIPAEIEVQGKTIPLDSPLYATLIDLMSMMPVGIGDILSHPEGKNLKADEVVGAVQILVACEIARPMRGMHKLENMSSLAQPRLVGAYNRHLATISLTGNSISLASPALGDVMTISPRDALVMQALNRVGLADSVSALLPELERLAQNPSQAAQVMDGEPTAESAKQMIEDVVSESILQWYAYGLLEAA